MDNSLLVAGVLGIATVGYGVVSLCLDAVRRKEYIDIALVALALAVVVGLLVRYSGVFVR